MQDLADSVSSSQFLIAVYQLTSDIVTHEQQERFKNDPQHYLKFRKMLEVRLLLIIEDSRIDFK